MRLAKTRDGWCVLDGNRAGALPAGTTLGSLLALPAAEFTASLAAVPLAEAPPPALLAPVDDDTEVWAAGVTYEVSREARMHESADADIYARVYQAERPELFFKSIGWRVAGPGAPIGVRADSAWDVPEPELGIVCNAEGAIVGYTIVNDVSSRSIEGENPLYLPQAKIFRGACAAGPWIVPASEIKDPYALGISVRIRRDGDVLWSGETSTARLHRKLDELAAYLFRGEVYPRGAVLATGTSAVPGDEITLRTGDEVAIEVDQVGLLENPVG
ncbi:fumarylacetoacetate hydrolase family protein [Amycolatopsis sp. GM8]|uniref:fumarylacetoacetate hydrolase family protein n=1 Tax=Amycolatopsis sp. GM8 TaxID=2896530 RepID=UPI001F00893E|nr:fumarylacetoacetate hydrolase family protein [Amycolatopsis sp. GM8]